MNDEDRRNDAIQRVVAVWDEWHAYQGFPYGLEFWERMSDAVNEVATFAPPIQRPLDKVLDEAAPWVKDEEPA